LLLVVVVQEGPKASTAIPHRQLNVLNFLIQWPSISRDARKASPKSLQMLW
jgi:hypothetical protein